MAKADGISMNQLIVCAVAEKISALATADYFAERKAHADLAAFDRILNRQGGEPPRPDDVIPEDLMERLKADEAARG